ncbi:hypothetical protein HELRODRAFT_168834 [Helobdella robusta]|uniref:Uncharacterized protein n=1 Tax=Helobdella robusta TaxID=6412 RepID=T1F107_HELRO|nr:hypothetical protein HELRODRAFT_168834 [Helobdella robusta]ESO08914.1 hypothetical protein HELRODRAFT_168834 [Helobdella robusta]
MIAVVTNPGVGGHLSFMAPSKIRARPKSYLKASIFGCMVNPIFGWYSRHNFFMLVPEDGRHRLARIGSERQDSAEFRGSWDAVLNPDATNLRSGRLYKRH